MSDKDWLLLMRFWLDRDDYTAFKITFELWKKEPK